MSLSARLILDLAMLVLFLASFAYRVTGNTPHEIGGVLLLVTALVHNALNWRWYLAVPRGRRSLVRAILTTVDFGMLVACAVVMASGLTNSRLLSRITGVEWEFLSRQLHSAAAHWMLIFAALHLGLHLRLIAGAFRRHFGIDLERGVALAVTRGSATMLFVLGLYAFADRSIAARLTASLSFDYWDPCLPVAWFLLEILALVVVGAVLSHRAVALLRRTKSSR